MSDTQSTSNNKDKYIYSCFSEEHVGYGKRCVIRRLERETYPPMPDEERYADTALNHHDYRSSCKWFDTKDEAYAFARQSFDPKEIACVIEGDPTLRCDPVDDYQTHKTYGFQYTMTLPDDVASKMGLYHDSSRQIPATIKYFEFLDDRSPDLYVATSLDYDNGWEPRLYGDDRDHIYELNYTPLNSESGPFYLSKKQVDAVMDYASSVMSEVKNDPNFRVSESVKGENTYGVKRNGFADDYSDDKSAEDEIHL